MMTGERTNEPMNKISHATAKQNKTKQKNTRKPNSTSINSSAFVWRTMCECAVYVCGNARKRAHIRSLFFWNPSTLSQNLLVNTLRWSTRENKDTSKYIYGSPNGAHQPILYTNVHIKTTMHHCYCRHGDVLCRCIWWALCTRISVYHSQLIVLFSGVAATAIIISGTSNETSWSLGFTICMCVFFFKFEFCFCQWE